MNKKLIALAVAAASFSGVAAAAEVYSSDTGALAIGGRAETRAFFTDGDLADGTRARINVAGTSVITDNLSAVAFTEFEYNPSSAFTGRHAYAGFAGDFGQITYGQQDGSLGVVTDISDIFFVSGGANSSKINVADRTTNNLLYINNFNGLNVKANYKFEEGQEKNAGFSASAMYDVAGFTFGAGYAQQDANGSDAKQIVVGAAYSIDNIYLGLTFNDSNDAAGNIQEGIEFAAMYTMGKTHFGAGYMTEKDYDGVATLEIGHKFNSNLRGAIAADIDLEESDDTTIAVQLRYDF
ncbi:porin [Thaumasiovibrio sp. DFM-14]|uniref:porin n=1 Tax=Thaumasiovibrio sp. DFM-14 TaxID=3384792 RepID=UPI0039A05DBB